MNQYTHILTFTKLIIIGVLILLNKSLCNAEAYGETRFTNEENCGISAISKASPRVVGGSDSVQGQWPWQAAVAVRVGGLYYVICGGSLIKRRWVLTSAHCVINQSNSDILVYLGVNDYLNAFEENRQIRQLTDKVCFEGYPSSSRFAHDICMLQLDSDVLYTTYVRPICLPAQGSSASAGETCIISGWGRTEGTADRNILQYAEVQIIDTTLCRDWYLENDTGIPFQHFCAGLEQGGIGSCQGDSGGPLACQETVSGTTSYVARGIVTATYTGSCSTARRPALYLEVAEYIEWIDLVVSESRASTNRPLLNVFFSTILFLFVSKF